MDITIKQNGAVFPKDVIVGHEGENNAKLLNISIPAIVDDNINLSILNVRIEITLSDGPVYTPIISKTYQDNKFLLSYNITDVITAEKGYFDAQIVAFSEDNQIKWASDTFKIKVERSVNATKAAQDYINKTYDDLKKLSEQTTLQAELAEDSADSAILSSNIATEQANIATQNANAILNTTSDNISEGSTHLFMSTAQKNKLEGIDEGAQVNPATSDNIAEGTTNLYYTPERAALKADASAVQSMVISQLPAISALTAKTSIADTDLFLLFDTANKKITGANMGLQRYIKTFASTDDLLSTTILSQGNYLVGTGTSVPLNVPTGWDTSKIGILSVFKITNYCIQIIGQTDNYWIRYHQNSSTPRPWKKLNNVDWYKSALSSQNIDSLYTEGIYILTLSGATGTLPTLLTGDYALIEVKGSGNYWTQTIYNQDSITVTHVWVRNWHAASSSAGWSPWKDTVNPDTPEPVNPSQPLYGKKILCFGDSITDGAGGTDNYPQYVGVRTGATVTNIGVGGTQMAQHVAVPAYDPFSFYNIALAFVSGDWTAQAAVAASLGQSDKLQLMQSLDLSTYDIITIAYGQNDRTHEVAIGTIDSTDVSTFLGALNVGINALWTAYPQLQFLLITPYHRPKVYEEGESTIEPYADALLLAGQSKYHIPVLDLFRTAGINDYSKSIYLNTADYLHPSTKGFEYLGNKIGGWITSVL